MIKRIVIVLAMMAVALNSAAAGHTTVIKSEKGERWWGIWVSGAPMEPFTESFEINTGNAASLGLHAPMVISSLGRYIWSDSPMHISFDGADFTITCDAAPVEVQKGGRNLREAYLVCCHKHCPPPQAAADLSLFDGPFYETALEYGMDHNAEQITDYAARLVREGFPNGVIVLSPGWEHGEGSSVFDPEFYPDPKAMADRMHSQGFKLMLTVTPFAAASGRSYAAAQVAGELLMGTDGNPLVVRSDGGYLACYDFSKPDVAHKLLLRLEQLQRDYGVDGFRFDCSGILPYIDGTSTASYFMENWLSLSKDMALSQAVPVSGAPHTFNPAGMQENTGAGWAALAGGLNDMLAAGLAGYSNCMLLWDGSLPDGEMAARMLQLSSVMPFASVPFAPWRAGDTELNAEVKNTVLRRAAITEYIKELAAESARTAEPIVRHMEYAFPRSGFSDCNDQFMIGSKYLVAPVLTQSAQRMVRLPRGVWVDPSGKKYRGPVVISASPSGGQPLWFELSK